VSDSDRDPEKPGSDAGGNFEKRDLRVEKIVSGREDRRHGGGAEARHYKFFDDYHPDTAKGTVTASPKCGIRTMWRA